MVESSIRKKLIAAMKKMGSAEAERLRLVLSSDHEADAEILEIGRVDVRTILAGFDIRLRRMESPSETAPGFRDLVERLQECEPDTVLADFAVTTGRESFRVFFPAGEEEALGVFVLHHNSEVSQGKRPSWAVESKLGEPQENDQ